MADNHHRRIAAFSCSQCLKALCDYLDRTQDASVAAAVEKHLDRCRKCRIVFETTARTLTLYRTVACDCCVPADVEARLLSAISHRVSAGRSG